MMLVLVVQSKVGSLPFSKNKDTGLLSHGILIFLKSVICTKFVYITKICVAVLIVASTVYFCI